MKRNEISNAIIVCSSFVVLIIGIAWPTAAKDANGEFQKRLVENSTQAVDKVAAEPIRNLYGAAHDRSQGIGSRTREGESTNERGSRNIIGDFKDIFPCQEITVPRKCTAVSDEQLAQKPAQPVDPVKQLFDFGERASRALDEVGQDVLALTWVEEQQVGREVHKMIARDEKISRPADIIQRLERLAKPFIEQRSRKEVTYKFHVLENSEANAFTHAGGYVYVTKGMLKYAKSDLDLEFFLAHEIAHEDLKHVVKRMTYAARASNLAGEVAGQMAQMAYLTIATGYSKEQELEADAWAFRAMRRAGRSRDEALTAMRNMLAHVTKQNLEPKQSEPGNAAEKTLRQIDNHFKSHPPTAERLERLEAIAD